jgi:hypothetical protein
MDRRRQPKTSTSRQVQSPKQPVFQRVRAQQKSSPQSERNLVRTTAADCPYANQTCPLPSDQPGCPIRYLGGEPVCAVGNLGTRIPSPVAGTYTLMPGLDITITTTDNIYFDWTATRSGVTAITVTELKNQYTYTYSNQETSGTGLHAPYFPAGECVIPAIRHIDICFDPSAIILSGLEVSTTAKTKFTRFHTWDVVKTSDTTNLVLSPGQTFLATYLVTASQTYVDSDWMVSGEITIKNTNTEPGFTITIDDVNDLVPPAANVSLPVALPYTLQPGETLSGTYSALTGAPGSGTNLAMVDVSSGSQTKTVTATASWDFSSSTTKIDHVDECFSVSDSMVGGLGSGCAFDVGGFATQYQVEIGPFDVCGDYDVLNTVTGVANDTGSVTTDSWVIAVHIPCVGGCTLSAGYWKTHSEHGPAPYDDTWAILPYGANTVFFFSGKTYYNVLQTASAGNAYYILAQQFIAAQLNQLNGTEVPPAVLTASNAAFDLFNMSSNTPAYIGGLKASNPIRKQFASLADTLDKYNRGLLGPAHCSE